MESFRISLAGLILSVSSRHPFSGSVCRDYLTQSGAAERSFAVSEKELEEFLSPEMRDEANAELMALCRSIAEWLPLRERCLLHGAAISYAGKGYLFLAPSGTGKSTHIRLWREHIGERVDIVNGDKPILDLSGEVPLICGTPWAGKERWQKPVRVPLAAVCLLQRGERDSILRAVPSEHLGEVLQQIYRPADPQALTATLALIDRLFAAVPLYLLRCTNSEAAVKTAFPALTGDAYPKG